MKKYTITLKHDTGTIRLTISAENIADAVKGVCTIEGAPECAVINVKIKDK